MKTIQFLQFIFIMLHCDIAATKLFVGGKGWLGYGGEITGFMLTASAGSETTGVGLEVAKN